MGREGELSAAGRVRYIPNQIACTCQSSVNHHVTLHWMYDFNTGCCTLIQLPAVLESDRCSFGLSSRMFTLSILSEADVIRILPAKSTLSVLTDKASCGAASSIIIVRTSESEGSTSSFVEPAGLPLQNWVSDTAISLLGLFASLAVVEARGREATIWSSENGSFPDGDHGRTFFIDRVRITVCVCSLTMLWTAQLRAAGVVSRGSYTNLEEPRVT